MFRARRPSSLFAPFSRSGPGCLPTSLTPRPRRWRFAIPQMAGGHEDWTSPARAGNPRAIVAQPGSLPRPQLLRARGQLRAWWRPRARTVVSVVALGAILGALRGVAVADRAPTPEESLARTLSRRGLSCEPGDVAWIDGPRGFFAALLGTGRAVVRASSPGEPSDLFLVEARRSPAGRLVTVGDVWNITSTSRAHEPRPSL